MVDTVALSIVRDIVTILGVVGGFTYYVMTVRASQKTQQLTLKAQELTQKTQEQALETRQAQLFMYIYDKWSSREYIDVRNEYATWEWTDYDDFMQKYGNNVEASAIFSQAATMFEGIGVLIKRKLIDPSMVDDLMSGATLMGWEEFGSVVKERRVRENKPYYFEFWEYLYDEVSSIAHKQHPELKT